LLTDLNNYLPRGFALSCDNTEFADVTLDSEVNNSKTKLNTFRILVVDDESSILDLFLQVLSRVNTDSNFQSKTRRSNKNLFCQNIPNLLSPSFDIVTSQQADEAVDAVKDSLEYDRPFSVAFIDVRMPPGPDGVWAAEHIRKLDSDIEIVIMTGHTDIFPGVIARRVPPAHKLLYIQKPFQSHEIVQFAFALSMKWHGEHKLREVHKELEVQVEEQIHGFKKVSRKLDGIIQSVTDHLSMIDEEYNIVWANHMVRKVFGENMVGKKCYQVYQRRDKPCQQCMVRKTFADGLAREQDKELIGKKGNKIIFRCSYKLAKCYEEGRAKRVVATFRDITELKEIEKELRKANDKAVSRYTNTSKMLSDTLKKLEQKEKDLEQHKSDLEKLKKEIIETNRAFSVLARNIDKNKEIFEKKIYDTTTVKILPIIKDLKNNKSCHRIMADLDVLETNLNSLFSGSINHHEIINILTDQEMKVAALIKRGLTNHKISNLLYISEHTVKTHRKNIRKKLKINNTNINLSTYLKSNMPSDLIRNSQTRVRGLNF
jgi:PAS domain S-box-containing protein